MSGSTPSTDEALARVDAYADDVAHLVNALQTPEDEVHAKSAREGIARSYRRMAALSAYAGNDSEATTNFKKATEWSTTYVEATVESQEVALAGSEDARELAYLVAVAVLSGDEAVRTEACRLCLSTTVEDAGDGEGYVALGKALAALVLDENVEDYLDAVPDDDAPALVSEAVACIRGIHEGRSDDVVRGIEGVLEAYAESAGPLPSDAVCLDALALFALARERSLVTYDDVSTSLGMLPEYQPEDQ